ncbi:MAG TPA: AMP-binding protein [Prolixibacteraceae bacterium]|nr:AMP-binding protein [Prolixibacteraceae bacterium]HPS12625.1 AMP-binding protein [Prolixibacteraceae bacterium]
MELIEKTLGWYIEKWAYETPDQDFLVYADRGLRFSYCEFNARVDKLAKGLLYIGIGKGDHVGIWATNVPDWLTYTFAAAKIGAIVVTVNTSYKVHELEYLMQNSDLQTLCLIDGWRDSDYIGMLNELVPELKTSERGFLKSEKFPCLKNIIYIGPEKHRGMYNTNELLLLGEHIDDMELEDAKLKVDSYDVVNMQYTSGTTGFPKGVMLTHVNILNNGFSIGDRQKFTAADRLCLPPPLFHCFGIVLGMMAVLTHGSTVVMIESFDPLVVLASIQKEKCTALYGVPTMFIAELNHPMFSMFDLSSLRTGIMAGSLCPIETMRAVIDKMFMKDITIVYGLTESSPGMTQSFADDPIEMKVATVGREFPMVEVKVADPDTGEELPVGQQGEMCCRGYNIMKGYYKNPEATAAIIDRDGWLHSGDLGVKDEDGNFRITGRIKDMIIRGGENIYPREIEEFLYLMPEIKDVQVAGVASEKYGEEVGAFIVLHDGKSLTEEDVKDYCRGKISRFKIPKYIFFMKEFPMTASGKIQKYKLRDMGLEMLKNQGIHVI